MTGARRPGLAGLVTVFLACHVVVWVGLVALLHESPPWDDIEQLVWSQSLQWGYYKHPPAPTWWVWLWTELLGRQVWVTYLAGQLSVAGALFCIWRVGARLTTPARAFAVVALSTLLGHYGFSGIMANHNTLQLLPMALLLWSMLLAVENGIGRGWVGYWGLVGAAAAWVLLSKYSALVWFAVLGLWLLLDPRMRSARAWLGVVVAAAVLLVLVTPHIAWLAETGFPAVRYAGQSVEGLRSDTLGAGASWVARALSGLGFLASQVVALLPPLAAFWILRAAMGRGAVPVGGAAGRVGAAPYREPLFVRLTAVGPFALVLLLGLVGMHLSGAWTTTFFLMSGFLLLHGLPEVQDGKLLKWVFVVALAADLLLAIGVATVRGPLVNDWVGRAARSNYPARALVARLQSAWHDALREPVGIVAGDTWLAGNVALYLPSHPLVFIDSASDRAPWMTTELLRRCDIVVLIDQGAKVAASSAQTRSLMQRAEATGVVDLPWTHDAGGPRVRVKWGIVRAPASGCPLTRGQGEPPRIGARAKRDDVAAARAAPVWG